VGHAGAQPGVLGQVMGAGFDAFALVFSLTPPPAGPTLLTQIATNANAVATRVAAKGGDQVYMAGCTTGSLPGQTLSSPSDAFLVGAR
jgi:hypothetical protein